MLQIVLLLNAVWFAMAFDAFYRRRKIFGKVMVPEKAHRDNSAYAALVESGRFMGGFNLALSAFNLLLLFNIGGFDKDSQWATLLFFNALAHGSQFAGNIPMALKKPPRRRALECLQRRHAAHFCNRFYADDL